MNRRHVIASVLVVVAIVTTGTLAVYSPTDATTGSPATPTELEGSYTVSERILTDGTLFVSRESTVDATTGEQRRVLSFENITYDTYWSGDGEQYTKVTAATEARLEEWLAETDDEVVRTVDDEHGVVHTASDETRRDDGPIDDTYPDRLVHSTLEMIAFTETGSTTVDGTTVDTYEPATGWTDIGHKSSSHDAMYVADADGEMYVGPDGTLHHANVTLERVTAETWGEYLLERDERWTTTFEYEVTESAADVRPDWMDDVSDE